MYTYELLTVGTGFGFNILQEGVPIIVSDYMPGVSGDVVMTEEVATFEAQQIINRLGGN